VKGNPMLIVSPCEADPSFCECLAGFLTDASSSRSSLPGVYPVASLAPALRAHSGGAVPDSHRLPD
jgi:hypothetical protein